MTCILHKLWSSYLFFAKSVSFPPFWLKFPWIFQNDQVLGNPFHVVCFIFKGGRGICVAEKPTSNVKSFPNFFTGSSHFQVSFHDWHFEEHHVWSSSQKTRVWLKELAWKAQFVSLFPQNKIAHLVCSLLPFRTGWHCGKGGFSSCLLKSLWLCLFIGSSSRVIHGPPRFCPGFSSLCLTKQAFSSPAAWTLPCHKHCTLLHLNPLSEGWLNVNRQADPSLVW